MLEIYGTIAEESWFDDDVTPALFREELFAGTGDVVIWINSPGGDCIAASEIVAIALAQIGYKEKASNKNLDDPAANAGSANWTKYARDLASAGYYNGNKNGFAWCDVFVDWCFFKAYGKDEGQRIQCQTGPYGAGCTYSMQYYQQQGRCDKNPKVGDEL